ncbi:glucosyl-3-phosphoglycerate synthase, partial [Streptomyces griseus]
MLEEVERWLTRRSWSSGDRPLNRLTDARDADPRRTSVSVVLPALNEEATVGAIVATIRRELMEKVRLVDELVVIDSGSTDATAAVARAAGARVVHRDAILPRIPALPGKGEVLWRSLLVTSGEIVCFVDADLKDFSADFVSGTIGPLLTDPTVQFVKAMYDRPLGDRAGQGGRVTELVARPLLNLHWPQLAGFVQPLGGEYAVRRSLLERLPFPVGYGVELGLLVDALHTVGLDALGQVDVGVRIHRHQDGQALGRMAAAIYRTA